jgi:hypothetical protein
VCAVGALGTDPWIDFPIKPNVGEGSATTIVVAHLAIQVLAIHVLPEYSDRAIRDINSKPSQWDDLLLNIWPMGNRPVTRPPSLTFTDSGPPSIALLMDRWRTDRADASSNLRM